MSEYETMWNNDTDLTDIERAPDYPGWIESMSPCDMAAITQGGCESGAYMHAVTYHTALATMTAHGDDVMEYIERVYGEVPPAFSDVGWSRLAVFYLSLGVELWVSCNIDEVANLLEGLEEE